jgi:hypothetical protein
MGTICKELQRRGNAGDLTGVEPLLLELDAEFERVRGRLITERDASTNRPQGSA